MPNFLVEAVMSIGVLLGTQRVLKMYNFVGKGYTFLAVTLAMVIFIYLPFMFNDGGVETLPDPRPPFTISENESDVLNAGLRMYFAMIFLFIFGIYIMFS